MPCYHGHLPTQAQMRHPHTIDSPTHAPYPQSSAFQLNCAGASIATCCFPPCPTSELPRYASVPLLSRPFSTFALLSMAANFAYLSTMAPYLSPASALVTAASVRALASVTLAVMWACCIAVPAFVMSCSRSSNARSTSALAANLTSFSAFATMTSASVSALSIVLFASTIACSSTVVALISCCSSSFLASSMSASAASLMSTASW
mmetsp:Transcript_24619/g.62116  ORF Transcript_24619/g.62116 Transcript_24619/m.62116 type:complete len:206 (+) Transcript_24619:254-871(+)